MTVQEPCYSCIDNVDLALHKPNHETEFVHYEADHPTEKRQCAGMAELKNCLWCQNKKGKTDLQFSVIDDDFGQYVKGSLIKFCPFCGRDLRTPKERGGEKWKCLIKK